MRRLMRWTHYVWASPYTLVGIGIGFLLGGRFSLVDGVIEIHGPRIAFVLQRFVVPATAMTLGHVVFGVDSVALARTRRHERVHVRQYERWGIGFVPAYCLASAWLWIRGGNAYLDNPFEKEAFAVDSRDSCGR